ncbi:response regulator [Paenibacillus sp. GCM10027626]|uniref:response regulator n=1 Tax=Paenibacillus sp. GCM10027626 TaxID=3273411 RepID=UPI00363D9645
MKALIVDDEKHVRNAIRLLVDWDGLGIEAVLEAEDGAAAILLIESEQPQLVITDIMMPEKSGIELMDWMETHAPGCKKIVISGHNDFEYVRHTMKHGGTDYLLKPVDRNQLQDAVRKAVNDWRETKRERLEYTLRNMEVNELKPVYRDKLLSGLLAEPGGFSSLREPIYRHFPELQTVNGMRAAVLCFDPHRSGMRDKPALEMDLLAFSIINICRDFLENGSKGVAFRNWNRHAEIVVLLRDDVPAAELLEKINEGFSRTLRLRFDIGVSSGHFPFPGGLPTAYKQALKALCQRNLLDRSLRIHAYQGDGPLRTGSLRFAEFEEQIRLAVKSGRPEQIQAAIGRWCDTVTNMAYISLDQLEMWWQEYQIMQARWHEDLFREADDHKASPETAPFIIPLDQDGKFSLSVLQQELTGSLIELSRAVSLHKQQSGSIMHEIARFIEANYARDITLKEISERFHLNREYISRKFSQEFRETIIDFLSRIRIEKAKLLLMNPHFKNAEVAQMIGYKDEKYFSRVFKKLEGKSPKDFRKQLDRAAAE